MILIPQHPGHPGPPKTSNLLDGLGLRIAHQVVQLVTPITQIRNSSAHIYTLKTRATATPLPHLLANHEV